MSMLIRLVLLGLLIWTGMQLVQEAPRSEASESAQHGSLGATQESGDREQPPGGLAGQDGLSSGEEVPRGAMAEWQGPPLPGPLRRERDEPADNATQPDSERAPIELSAEPTRTSSVTAHDSLDANDGEPSASSAANTGERTLHFSIAQSAAAALVKRGALACSTWRDPAGERRPMRWDVTALLAMGVGETLDVGAFKPFGAPAADGTEHALTHAPLAVAVARLHRDHLSSDAPATAMNPAELTLWLPRELRADLLSVRTAAVAKSASASTALTLRDSGGALRFTSGPGASR